MFSLKQILKQEPAAIVSVLVGWLTVFVVVGVIDWSAEVLQTVEGVGIATLLLFYVRPTTVSKDALSKLFEADQLQTRLSEAEAAAKPKPRSRTRRA